MQKFYLKNKPLINISIISIIVVIFSFVLGNYIFSKINVLRKNNKDLNTKNEMLLTKVSELKTYEKDISSDLVNVTTSTLPISNSGLFALSQLRNLAANNALSIEKASINGIALVPNTKDIYLVSLEIEVKGEDIFVARFISEISNSMPLMEVVSIRGKASKNELNSIIGIYAYYSPLPEFLPTITESIEGLSENEMALFEKVKNYKKPTINTVVNPEFNLEDLPQREDPFI